MSLFYVLCIWAVCNSICSIVQNQECKLHSNALKYLKEQKTKAEKVPCSVVCSAAWPAVTYIAVPVLKWAVHIAVDV